MTLGQTAPTGLVVALASGVVVCAVGLLAWALDAPALAPPLGVTALLCLRSPESAVSAPRSVLLGHLCGVGSGLLALCVTGAAEIPSAMTGPFALSHALASGLAITLTAIATQAWRCPHPPAAATTLVVSLGLLHRTDELLAFSLGVLATVGVSHIARVLLSLPAPFWKPLPGTCR